MNFLRHNFSNIIIRMYEKQDIYLVFFSGGADIKKSDTDIVG